MRTRKKIVNGIFLCEGVIVCRLSAGFQLLLKFIGMAFCCKLNQARR